MNINPILHLILMYYCKRDFLKIFELCYIYGNDLEVARLCNYISAIQLYTYFLVFIIFIIIILIMRYNRY